MDQEALLAGKATHQQPEKRSFFYHFEYSWYNYHILYTRRGLIWMKYICFC